MKTTEPQRARRDRSPAIFCGHTPPYYQEFFERFGFQPARGDNLAYAIELDDTTPAAQRLFRLADWVRTRGRTVVREADLEHWDKVASSPRLIRRETGHVDGGTRSLGGNGFLSLPGGVLTTSGTTEL